MKKWVIGIIAFMSAIFLIGTMRVKALEPTDYYGINDINITNISSLSGYSDKYVIYYSYDDMNYSGGKLYIYFLYSNLSYTRVETTTSSDYTNSLCLTQGINESNGCFNRLWSDTGQGTRYRFNVGYVSSDLGNTWTQIYNSSNNYNSGLLNRAYLIKTTIDIKTMDRTTLVFSSGYEYVADIPVESLPNIVYNISVEDNGDMALNYYFNTPNNSGVNLILCIRYTVEGNEGFSCTRDFTNNITHQFKPIYPSNTYYLSYENLDNGNVIYQIELNIQDYIDSLPDIEKQDIIAEYTYYNVDYLSDSPKALTNLLNVLITPIQIISEIVAYIWSKFNVYLKLFLIGMFSALIMSSLIKYIK